MLQQNPPTEDEDSIITKLSSKRTWKSYLDFHKFVIHVENMFRGYLQHAEAISNACISLVIEALQVSSTKNDVAINLTSSSSF